MAKSTRTNEIEAHRTPLTAPLSRDSYWEHWFGGQPQSLRPQAIRPVDEHGIWEKAVNLEIFAMEGAENTND
jgi:hypothetical protein